MRILSVCANSLNRTARTCVLACAMLAPMKAAKDTPKELPKVCIEYFHTVKKVLPEPKLKVLTDTNFLGGIVQRYDDKSVEVIKSRILKQVSVADYVLPIANAKNVYLEKFGMYMANRPRGKRTRPHLGLDIFVSPYSRKPATPVVIRSPIDGIVISRKTARPNDNLIANTVTILGIDGRRYAFDHLARPEDYPNPVELPKLGAALKKGDKIGYVGSTGETTLWHLHFVVMTDEKLAEQQSSKFWREFAAQSNYTTLKGQVDPLDEKEAGPIAKLLKKYRGSLVVTK